jgi:hypothetical protein
MRNSMNTLPVVSRIVCLLGALVFLSPGFFFLIAHMIWPVVPEHVGFLTEILVSTVGVGICLLGAIPALIKANRAEDE